MMQQTCTLQALPLSVVILQATAIACRLAVSQNQQSLVPPCAAAGDGSFGNSFWSNSPRDHVMPRDHVVQSFLVKKLNPYGSISSPRETKIASGWNSPTVERPEGGQI